MDELFDLCGVSFYCLGSQRGCIVCVTGRILVFNDRSFSSFYVTRWFPSVLTIFVVVCWVHNFVRVFLDSIGLVHNYSRVKHAPEDNTGLVSFDTLPGRGRGPEGLPGSTSLRHKYHPSVKCATPFVVCSGPTLHPCTEGK